MRCPICDNFIFKKLINLYDDRYGEPNFYSIIECTQCRHYCTFPRINNNQLSALYGNFYPRKNINLESIVKEAKKETSKFSGFFRWLKGTNNQGQFYAKKDDLFLDIGCGSGASLIEAEYLGANAFGLEADPNVEKIRKALNLNIFQGNLDESPLKDISFNLIVLNQVIEHIPEPDTLLESLNTKLTKDGLIIISLPNINSFWRFLFKEKWINWHVPYHLHHFNDKNFIASLGRSAVWVLANGLFQTFVALMIALLINQPFKGQNFVRTWIILPWAVPAAVTAILWRWMFDATSGIINTSMMRLGIMEKPALFLANPEIVGKITTRITSITAGRTR